MYCTTPSGTRYQIGCPSWALARTSLDEIAIAGTSTSCTSPSGRWCADRSNPGRVTPTNCARSHSSSTSFQVRICANASAPVMKNNSAAGRILRMSRSVSMVYVAPARSMSTRLTVNRGLDAVATTVIRYRCSAELTWSFCHGRPVGTNTTSSRPSPACTSLAATRWPWWIGSNVPPITPIRGARSTAEDA